MLFPDFLLLGTLTNPFLFAPTSWFLALATTFSVVPEQMSMFMAFSTFGRDILIKSIVCV
jgi:hypothetical protein